MDPKNYVQNPDYLQLPLLLGENELKPKELEYYPEYLDEQGKKRWKTADHEHKSAGAEQQQPVNDAQKAPLF